MLEPAKPLDGPELEDKSVDSPVPVDELPDQVDDYPSLVDEDPIAVGEDADTLGEDPDTVDEDPDAVDLDPDVVDEDPDAGEAHPGSAETGPGSGRSAPAKPAEDRTGKDTRRGRRVRVSGIATLETGGLNATNQAVCTVRDLSRSGIGLETGQPPEVGQTVRLRLVLNGQMVTLSTIATRVDRRANSNFYHLGLDWSRCKPEELAFLDGVLNAVDPPERVKSKPRK